MTESEAILEPLLTDSKRLRVEAMKRRNTFEQISVPNIEVQTYLENGWELDKPLKRKTRLKRPLSIDAQLENRIWTLLYQMGYQELNLGRSFTIQIERKGAETIRKQIDVFAKDEETVVVAECKASDNITQLLHNSLVRTGSVARSE